MEHRKFTAILIFLLLTMFTFTACKADIGVNGNNTRGQKAHAAQAAQTGKGQKKENAGHVTLTVQVFFGPESAKVLEEIMKEFTQSNPDVKIDFSAMGIEYESIMKIKMASRDMPDIFSTHGWSKIRYGKYLADLKDRVWTSDIEDSFRTVITDNTGKVFVLAFDQDKSGIVYNPDIFKEHGVEVPETFDEFMAACEAIKTKSRGKVTPVFCTEEDLGGARFLDLLASSLFISPKKNYAQQLLDGSFDWRKWDLLAEKWLEMYNKGYINEDMLVAESSYCVNAFAGGKAAFAIRGPVFIENVRKVNPNAALDMMPIPAMVEGDTPTFAGGEASTIGVWKDSKNLGVAMQIVDFCAKPENVEKMCAVTKLPPAMKGVRMNAGELTAAYERYKDIPTLEYFDRAYLPSGMWDVICENSQSMIGGQITPRQFSENMKKEYERLRKAVR